MPASLPVQGDTYRRLSAYAGELTAFRRDLHAHPEIGFEEVRTGGRVVEALRLSGVDEVHTGIGRTGIVGIVRGRTRPGAGAARLVGLRADLDALPLREENDCAWRSTRSGLMHACGHDGHTAMLVGAARDLAAHRDFEGDVALIFQPGEEGFAGAKAMIDDGLFERFPVEAVYAMHNWPSLPAGHIGLNDGPMMAAADRIEITINGRGGHGAHPHLAIDPVLVAGHLITAVQSLVSRNVSPLDSAVVSLCAMQAGDTSAYSVIPRQARLVGTVRTFRADVQQTLEERLARLVESVAAGFGATATLDYQRGYPATVNDARHARRVAEVATALVGESRVVRDLPPSMGAEDFAFMLQVKPGAYFRLGQADPQAPAGSSPFLHSPRYDFNDAVLPLGAAMLAGLARRTLAGDAPGSIDPASPALETAS